MSTKIDLILPCEMIFKVDLVELNMNCPWPSLIYSKKYSEELQNKMAYLSGAFRTDVNEYELSSNAVWIKKTDFTLRS